MKKKVCGTRSEVKRKPSGKRKVTAAGRTREVVVTLYREETVFCTGEIVIEVPASWTNGAVQEYLEVNVDALPEPSDWEEEDSVTEELGVGRGSDDIRDAKDGDEAPVVRLELDEDGELMLVVTE